MRPKAAKVCPVPGCPEDQPCSQHAPKPWANVRQRRPDDLTGRALQQRNARIIAQHHGRCHVCGQPGATEVDHVTPEAEGGSSDDANLAPIHPKPCHEAKTKAEAARGRARHRQ